MSATRATAPHGDPVPRAVTRYLDAIDDGQPDDAATAFTAHCRYAVPVPGAHETDPRSETIGASALRSRFRERGATRWLHRILLCANKGADGLIEGMLVSADEEPVGGFAASFRLGPDGRIARYLAFVTADVPDSIPPDVAPDRKPVDALEILERYFEALDDGKFDVAADCFAQDTMYSHPPYRHTGIDGEGRVVFRGRSELRAAFAERGQTAFGHRILVAAQSGPHCLIEGAVHGLPGGGDGSFVSSLSLAADGTIGRYVSFYCEPAVPGAT